LDPDAVWDGEWGWSRDVCIRGISRQKAFMNKARMSMGFSNYVASVLCRGFIGVQDYLLAKITIKPL